MHKGKGRANNITAIGPGRMADGDNVIVREHQTERRLVLILLWALVLGIVAMSVDYVWNMVPQHPVDASEPEIPRGQAPAPVTTTH